MTSTPGVPKTPDALREAQRLLLHVDWSLGGWCDHVPEPIRDLWDHLGFDARVLAWVEAERLCSGGEPVRLPSAAAEDEAG
jgi:hypothetical protein